MTSNINGFKSASEDVNAKDANGATQLHLAVSDNNIGRVLALLEHPKIDINAKDLESGWTALHRALYLGHLRIAVLLVQHKDINLMIEDKDRNTALDVCLSTLPNSLKQGPCPGDALYTWGSNSNLTLGHNDGDDRKMPELVRFPYQSASITFPRAKSAKPTLYHLSMNKFHTAISTSESGLSAKVWGFGAGGRLGSDNKMQLCPAPVHGIQGIVVTTALGRDHTVLVTARGEVFTMGNNKYGQLGYLLDVPKNGQDPFQLVPKRVIIAISKLVVKGAAASRWHTVVHTENELFTFGFNYGQLGYERKGDIQVGPRKVATIPSGKILQVAASESATACLMASFDVVVFHKYAYHKISFPLSPYPEAFVQSMVKTRGWNSPCKISCSENKFGAMTALGDVFVWSYPEVDSGITLGSLPANHSIPFSSIPTPEKPRRVWAYGGDRTQAIDFALGHNGSVILLTKGGHVYIGANKGNSLGRNIKWQRIPHLDRVVQVNANPSGAWAALRSESSLTPVPIRNGCLGADLEQSLSQFHLYQMNEKNQGGTLNKIVAGISDDDDSEEDDDQKAEPNPWRINAQGWVNIDQSWDFDLVPLLDQEASFTSALGNSVSGSHLFDIEVQAGKRCLGAHRIILAARSPAFRQAFVENSSSRSTVGSLVMVEPLSDLSQGRLYTVHLKVELATAVLLLQFLYSDRIDPFWDAFDLPKPNKPSSLKIRQELYHLALELGLPTLQASLQYTFTHACSPSLSVNLAQVLDNGILFNGLSDVKLMLKDGFSMNAHQVILGHRSPFFNAMFVRTNEWIRDRQGQRRLPPSKGAGDVEDSHMLSVDMRHMSFESTQLVLRYMYSDCGPEMFDGIEKDEMDDLVQVVLNVLQISDEWLIDRLKDICEQVLGDQVRAKTVVNFLEFALMYGAKSLEATCIDYLCHNIESALDQRWLEGVEDDILILIENAIKEKQHSMSPWVRSGGHLPDPMAVEKMRDRLQTHGPVYYVEQGGGEYHDVLSTFKPLDRSRSMSGENITESSAPHAGSSTPPQPVTALETFAPPTSVSSVTEAWPPGLVESPGLDRSNAEPPTRNTTMEWPSLSDSPLPERRDTPALPPRKTSWGQVPSENIGQSSQSSRDDNSDGVSMTLKPSLRDILEHEQRRQREHGGQLEHAGGIKITGSMAAPKSNKLSQKERRKLLQQQPSLEDTPPQSTVPSNAWSRVLPGEDTQSLVRRDSHAAGLVGSSASLSASLPSSSPSFLDIQQSELALFRSQPKEVPKVAIATSKPVKETMRPSSERLSSEAPWRLDAIPEPLRAVSRHRSQMYPTSGSPMSRLYAGKKSSSNVSLSSQAQSSPLSDAALLDPEVLIGNMDAAHSGPSVLSSFAIIQNQQLRDRNTLLKARHHKKSMYQIQIEEQALSQIRLMHLEQAKSKSSEGTGEWFTCEISV